MSTEFSAPTTGDVIRASGIGFGTSGARGLVDDLSDEACAAFVLAFVSVAGQRFDFGRIAVGWDLRPSSPRIAAAVMAAVRAAGLEAECCGMLPTPRSEEHTSELQSLLRITYAVFCLKKQTNDQLLLHTHQQ